MNKLSTGLMFGVAANLLVGCGGGSGSAPQAPNSQASAPNSPEPSETFTVSGQVADGYLVNARVCLDINANFSCDAGEPQVRSSDRGNYSIAITDQANVGAPIVVDIIAGETVDSDTGLPVTQSYSLYAEGDNRKFISPLSVLAYYANTWYQDSATRDVLDQFGVPSGYDLTNDYVAGSASIDGEAHNIARIYAAAIAQAFAQVDWALVQSQGIDRKQVLLAVLHQIYSHSTYFKDQLRISGAVSAELLSLVQNRVQGRINVEADSVVLGSEINRGVELNPFMNLEAGVSRFHGFSGVKASGNWHLARTDYTYDGVNVISGYSYYAKNSEGNYVWTGSEPGTFVSTDHYLIAGDWHVTRTDTALLDIEQKVWNWNSSFDCKKIDLSGLSYNVAGSMLQSYNTYDRSRLVQDLPGAHYANGSEAAICSYRVMGDQIRFNSESNVISYENGQVLTSLESLLIDEVTPTSFFVSANLEGGTASERWKLNGVSLLTDGRVALITDDVRGGASEPSYIGMWSRITGDNDRILIDITSSQYRFFGFRAHSKVALMVIEGSVKFGEFVAAGESLGSRVLFNQAAIDSTINLLQ